MKRAARSASLAGLLAIAGCTAPGPADEAARRAEALQAAVPAAIDCGQFAAKPVHVEARALGSLDGTPAAVGPVLNVRLHGLRAVSPLVKPGRQEKSGARFAGLVPFRVEGNGTYAVLVASTAWADLAEAKPPRLVAPQSFKWLTVCGTQFKSGLYALEPGRDYFVQLWDSPDRELTVMIRRLL
ncbi:MAG TPA: hypothetical protein VJM14_13590 [Burkholderiales bacterium]|nr:hypothetical protein [Burkholderiales bacterium]